MWGGVKKCEGRCGRVGVGGGVGVVGVGVGKLVSRGLG